MHYFRSEVLTNIKLSLPTYSPPSPKLHEISHFPDEMAHFGKVKGVKVEEATFEDAKTSFKKSETYNHLSINADS